MLWALLLALGGMLIAGPIGAIIGLLIGIVAALMSNASATRRFEREMRAAQQAGQPVQVAASKGFWTPANIVILAIALAVGFVATEADKAKDKPPPGEVAETAPDPYALSKQAAQDATMRELLEAEARMERASRSVGASASNADTEYDAAATAADAAAMASQMATEQSR